MDKITYVTKPSLPDLEQFIPYLKEIWDSRVLTNNGKFHQLLESELASFLGVKYVSLFANGTLALVTAIQALKLTGEVITTPYSFVATTNSILWNNLTPVFVDIDPVTCNIDAKKIEGAITNRTTAILPVHVYGNCCDVRKIKEIADLYNLKVIYDAAHAFGVNYLGQSVLNYGDLSILSFHATKVFNTMEGGAIISHDENTKKRIDYLKNFGYKDDVSVIAAGINSKMNEMQAALGLLQLKCVNENIIKRKQVSDIYVKHLTEIKGISLLNFEKDQDTFNYSYFPIFIEKEYRLVRDEVFNILKSNNILCRKYFYPLISNFSLFKEFIPSDINSLPNANQIANSVLCLPIFPDLNNDDIYKIIRILKNNE